METCGTCARIRRKLRKLLPKTEPVEISYAKPIAETQKPILMNLAIDTINRELYDGIPTRETLDLLESHMQAWTRQIATQRLHMPKRIYRKEPADV